MAEGIELTKDEQIAKDHFIYVVREGHKVPCDYDVSSLDESLPSWYDETLYKRGQQFYRENRAAIMYSNLIGLICLLAEPRGLAIMQSTGRSSTIETARKRYISTISHTLSWYDVDLSPGSKSFESLRKVRKLHYLSSKAAQASGLGFISQSELAITTFGFMGFVLIRPQILGVRADNDEDRKAFVHFWAVLCHMIGISDRFNICLLPFDALLIFCQMVMRYVLLPLIQLETPGFKDMTTAMLKGMKPYLHNVDYEIDLFCAKQLLVVPGYQCTSDNSLEVHCRSILTQNDIDDCKRSFPETANGIWHLFSVDIPVIEVTKGQVNDSMEVERIDSVAVDVESNKNKKDQILEIIQYLRNVIKLGSSDHVALKFINYEKDWQKNLNDSKFQELSIRAKFAIKFKQFMRMIYNSTIGRHLIEGLIGFVLYRIQKANLNYHPSRQVQSA